MPCIASLRIYFSFQWILCVSTQSAARLLLILLFLFWLLRETMKEGERTSFLCLSFRSMFNCPGSVSSSSSLLPSSSAHTQFFFLLHSNLLCLNGTFVHLGILHTRIVGYVNIVVDVVSRIWSEAILCMLYVDTEFILQYIVRKPVNVSILLELVSFELKWIPFPIRNALAHLSTIFVSVFFRRTQIFIDCKQAEKTHAHTQRISKKTHEKSYEHMSATFTSAHNIFSMFLFNFFALLLLLFCCTHSKPLNIQLFAQIDIDDRSCGSARDHRAYGR